MNQPICPVTGLVDGAMPSPVRLAGYVGRCKRIHVSSMKAVTSPSEVREASISMARFLSIYRANPTVSLAARLANGDKASATRPAADAKYCPNDDAAITSPDGERTQ